MSYFIFQFTPKSPKGDLEFLKWSGFKPLQGFGV